MTTETRCYYTSKAGKRSGPYVVLYRGTTKFGEKCKLVPTWKPRDDESAHFWVLEDACDTFNEVAVESSTSDAPTPPTSDAGSALLFLDDALRYIRDGDRNNAERNVTAAMRLLGSDPAVPARSMPQNAQASQNTLGTPPQTMEDILGADPPVDSYDGKWRDLEEGE
jgi:hypothetical protein